MDQMMPNIQDFERIKSISRGAFGKVFLAQRKGNEDDKIYAVKSMPKSEMVRKNMVNHVINERDALAAAKSPFIVKLYYSLQTSQYIYLVMEYMIGGDLKSLLGVYGFFEELMARMYCAEVAKALDYLHQLGIIHRDIKPDNILVSSNGHVKLTDFGLSHVGWNRQINISDVAHGASVQTPARTPGQIMSLTSTLHFNIPHTPPVAQQRQNESTPLSRFGKPTSRTLALDLSQKSTAVAPAATDCSFNSLPTDRSTDNTQSAVFSSHPSKSSAKDTSGSNSSTSSSSSLKRRLECLDTSPPTSDKPVESPFREPRLKRLNSAQLTEATVCSLRSTFQTKLPSIDLDSSLESSFTDEKTSSLSSFHPLPSSSTSQPSSHAFVSDIEQARVLDLSTEGSVSEIPVDYSDCVPVTPPLVRSFNLEENRREREQGTPADESNARSTFHTPLHHSEKAVSKRMPLRDIGNSFRSDETGLTPSLHHIKLRQQPEDIVQPFIDSPAALPDASTSPPQLPEAPHLPGSSSKAVKFSSSSSSPVAELHRTTSNPLMQTPHDFSLRTPLRTPKSVRRHPGRECNNQVLGTPDYIAPELLLEVEHDCAVDWWSLGVCLFEFLTGVPPFNDETPELVFEHARLCEIPWPDGDEQLSDASCDCISQLLQIEPKKRLKLQGLQQHSLFAHLDWDHLLEMTPYFLPCPDDPTDTTYFDARNQLMQGFQSPDFNKCESPDL